jgi:hypothetical protein
MAFSPSIVPAGSDHDVYLVLDELGARLGKVWRETEDETTDNETVIRRLLEGECANPVRVVAFDTEKVGRATSQTISPISCGSAARSAARCRVSLRSFWSVMIPALREPRSPRE